MDQTCVFNTVHIQGQSRGAGLARCPPTAKLLAFKASSSNSLKSCDRVIAKHVHFAKLFWTGGELYMNYLIQNVNLNRCTHGQLFKAISKIQAKAPVTCIKDSHCIEHHMKHMIHMANHVS